MSNLRALAVLGLTLPAAVACATTPSPADAPSTATTTTPLRATGNEPGWRLDIGPAEMVLLTNFGQTRLVAPAPAAHVDGATTTYVARTGQDEFRVTVVDRVCIDSMSGMPHPKTVNVIAGSQTLSGCGGEPASLLQGSEWTVARIDGKPLVAGSKVTLAFAPDGGLSGSASCNRFVSGYKLSGEGLSISQAAGTMMMCDDALMEQERVFFEALGKVSGFAIAADGALLLRLGDGRTIEARR